MYRNWNHSNVNQVVPQGGSALLTHRALWRKIVENLLEIPGASVVGSSDAVAAGLDGVNRWDADSDLIWEAPGVAHSWIVIKFANMSPLPSGSQLLISLEGVSANGTNALTMWSPSAAFTGGSVTLRPTSAQEVQLGSSPALTATNGLYVVHMPFTNDGKQFNVFLVRAGTVLMAAVIGATRFTNSNIAGNFDDAPTFAIWNQIPSAGAAAWAQFGNTASTRLRTDAPLNLLAYHTVEGWQNTTTPTQLGVANELSAKWPLWPVRMASETVGARGVIGVIPDWFFVDNALVTGDVLTVGVGQDWAVFDDIAIPWIGDGTGPWITDSAPVTTFRSGEIQMFASDGGLISATDAGELNIKTNTARWTPVHLEFDVGVGESAVVLAQIGEDSGVWLCAYSAHLGSAPAGYFSPLFSSKSVAVVTPTEDAGATAAPRRYVLDVLPNGGWQRPYVKLVPLIAREVV